MATESPIRMLESNESKKWLSTVDPAMFSSPFSNVAGHEGFTKILKESGVFEEQSRMTPSRSGSAPPTVEGSIAAFRTLMGQRDSTLTNSRNEFLDCESEEQMRTNPAYIAYYYANVNLNPRLPPPLISRENRHLVRLMGGFGSKNVPVTEGLLATHKEEPEEEVSPEQKGDFFQAPPSATSTTVKGENDHAIDTVSTTDQVLKMQEPYSGSGDVHIVNCHSDYLATATRCSKTSDIEDNVSSQRNFGSDISAVESRMKSLHVPSGLVTEENQKRHDNMDLRDYSRLLDRPLQDAGYQVPGSQSHAIPQAVFALHGGMEKLAAVHPKLLATQPFMHHPGLVSPLYAATAAYMNPANFLYPSLPQPSFPSPQFGLGGSSPSSGFHPPPFGGYPQNNAFPMQIDGNSTLGFLKPPMEAITGEMNPYTSQLLYLSKQYAQHEFMLRPSSSGPFQGQFFRPSFEDAQRSAVHQTFASGKDSGVGSLTCDREHSPATGRLTISSPVNGSHIGLNYYGYHPSLGMPQFPVPSPAVPGCPMAVSNHPGIGNDLTASQHSPGDAAALSGFRGQKGPDSSDNSKRHSFLELLKSCSSRKLELSDIGGQIVDFSTDQHGSRFIQQKLEHCSSGEKESVFKEVLPHASKLMTDVFGNYVIQKFFEHGTAEQRRKLGEQLTGQILTLSLQMYGCRVIQKALEVIELDQKVKLVQELDGHVMKCVHDQNGNHVIQKCIESIPAEKIGFIISPFNGQVATLSSHPYGCRVIQRILEHCSDEKISQSIVDEILEASSMLAQDPYGNYVTQHILEMGKPHERSQIIQKLKHKFVQMSQHKFASNVVEKCLKYGNALERDLIIEEIVAPCDNDDALLAMMKDQFANYVVQKIFDMGTEKRKEALLNCIQTHLPVLKRFTYAKQIVARYEQLAESSLHEQE